MSVGITIASVEKVYGGPPAGLHALGPVDLGIEPATFVSLLGPSGCGKSTLLLMLAGLLPPSAGEVAIAGRPVRGPYTDLGIVFQSHALVDWRTGLGTVLLQVALGAPAGKPSREGALALLAWVGLAGSAARPPYDPSGGMQQRAAFCRALVHDPPLVLMDEPLGALDAMTREQLRADLETLWMRTRKTVVLVTHSVEKAVRLSDRVVVVSPRPGRFVRDIAVDLPRPRTLEVCETPAFHGLVAEIRRLFTSYGVI